MSAVKVRCEANGDRNLPVFAELECAIDAVRQRAFDLFSGCGGRQGSDIDDSVTVERELMGLSPAEMKEDPDE